MLSDVPSRNTGSYKKVNNRFCVITAFIIACALFVHTFDSCSSHLGALANTANVVTQFADICDETPAETCEICASRHPDCSDACDTLSEVAVRTSTNSQSQFDVTIISYSLIPPVAPIEIVLSGSLDPRAGPAFIAPLSVDLRTALPSRAPPRFV